MHHAKKGGIVEEKQKYIIYKKKNDYEYGIGKLEMMTEGEKEEENGAK